MMRFGPDAWSYGVLAVTLIVASVTDVRRGKIYNWTTYPAMVAGLIGHTLTGGLWGHDGAMGLTGALMGLAVGFGPLLLAWLAGGIGGGDAKIMGAVGALAGWRFALTALFYGLAVAAVMAVAILIRRRLVLQTFGRIGRFCLLWLTKAHPGSPATEQSPKLPFGLALCVGAGAALVLTFFYGPSERMFLLGI
jgi:prepilin peptidase CpaA